jgi:DNA-binding transcriptional regulator GbsR (MarR family)
MSEGQVLRALVAKRREIASGLNHHRLAEIRLAKALEHVDATIRLFTDETGQALISVLWRAGKPLSTDELAGHVGITSKRAGQALRCLLECDLVRLERALWIAKY